MLCEVYGEECSSRARVFEWHKRFCSGREDVEDDDRSGRPTTSSTNENVEKIDKIIRQDRRLSVRAVAEMVNIDRESVRKILVENLNIKKVYAKMVPKNLTIDQKFNRKEICSDTLKIIKDDPSFINNIITCDETWIFTYDPETKRQSMHWRTPTSPRMKKARMSKSKFKAMLIVFFDIKGIIFVEWVPSGQTVNQYYYKEVLIKLRERVRKKRPDLWKNGWVLHQDNAPAHSAFSIQRFLTEKKISVLQHPPYSPDLAPCDFFLFPKIKSFLKGTHFQTVDDLHHQEVAATLLHGGKTAHSAFKLPLNLNTIEIPTCNINKQSNMANVLKKCKLIVWDESPMSHKKGFEALNNSLKDLRNSILLMGGVTVLLAGDFRQTLPIVPRGTRANEIAACIKSSYLWPKIEKFSLTKNMQVHLKGDKTAEQFSELLLKIRDGKYPECEENITLPTGLGTVVNTLQGLAYKIYPGIKNLKEISMDWLYERAILTSKNDTAKEINKILLGSFQAKKNGIQIGEFGAGNR
ncbi:hypothetical protein QTP88_026315 [Uroleucon formosanum]